MRTGYVAALALAAAVGWTTANAAVVDWTQWSPTFTTSLTNGGAATGTSGVITVNYAGELDNLFFSTPSWGPPSTFSGGTVSNPPATSDGIIQLQGGTRTGTNTITFSSAVLNPVMAIWSLGSGGIPARFVFNTSNLALEAGGPSNEFGGNPLTLSGNTVSGREGNGVVQFNGLVKSISWTNPDSEFWYGFTVGTPGEAAGGVPEPAAWTIMLVGFGGLGAMLRRRRLATA
jgi:hypothetical protein